MTPGTTIDGHVHLWNRSTDPQPWIDPETMGPIDRDFFVDDLSSMLDETMIDTAIVVQSSNSFAETQRLLASANDRVVGVVGWVDLTTRPSDQLLSLSSPERQRLVGIRHLAHVDPDTAWLGRDDVGQGLAELGDLGLAFDLVVRWWQLPLVSTVVARHPELQFVLDHLGGPPLGSADLCAWTESMRDLATYPNVVVKISGAAAEIKDDAPMVDRYREVVDATVALFGADRLMYGSDWPLVELAGGPLDWRDTVAELLNGLSPLETGAVFGGTAQRVYHLAAG